MMSDFIPRECCGATFGHRPTCSHFATHETAKQVPALRIEVATLYKENVELKQALEKAEKELQELKRVIQYQKYIIRQLARDEIVGVFKRSYSEIEIDKDILLEIEKEQSRIESFLMNLK